MPEQLMDHYESIFQEHAKEIQRKLSDADNDIKVTNLDEDLQSARQALDQLEIEALGEKQETRGSRLERLNGFRADLKKLNQGVTKYNANKARRMLLNSNPQDFNLEDGPNAHLLSANDRIDRSQKMALEAEEIGASVLTDLRKQREQIQRASRALQDTDHDLDKSNKLLRDILRKMAENRILTMAIVTLLLLAILLVIYQKIFH